MGCIGRKVGTNVLYETVQEVHHNVLNQLVVMEPYVDKHLEEIYAAHDGQRMEAWVQKQHKISFMTWIKELQDIPRGEFNEARLASSPSTQITTWQGYDINGYMFYTKRRRTRRAWHRIVVFDMRASRSQWGRLGHTLGRLKRYGNLTTAVTYS